MLKIIHAMLLEMRCLLQSKNVPLPTFLSFVTITHIYKKNIYVFSWKAESPISNKSIDSFFIAFSVLRFKGFFYILCFKTIWQGTQLKKLDKFHRTINYQYFYNYEVGFNKSIDKYIVIS